MQNLHIKEANALFRLTNQGVNVQTIKSWRRDEIRPCSQPLIKSSDLQTSCHDARPNQILLQDILPLHLSFIKFNHSSHTYVAREAGGPGAGAVATTGRSCL
jgi:hypothetical protein